MNVHFVGKIGQQSLKNIRSKKKGRLPEIGRNCRKNDVILLRHKTFYYVNQIWL